MKLLIIFIMSSHSYAIDYFKSGINYWEESPPVIKNEKSSSKDPPKTISHGKDSSFNWSEQLDPKNDEFFREGDYLPPKAFMELVRNPSDGNIQNWFMLIEKKNKLSKRLSARISGYLKKKGSKLKTKEKLHLVTARQNLPSVNPAHKNYRFRMYFDSKCPHCKRMMKTLGKLGQMGFYVDLKQTDSDTRGLKDIPFPISKATKKELHDKDIKSVPVLFVGDLKNKVIYRLTGYQSVQSIFSSIKSKRGISLK